MIPLATARKAPVQFFLMASYLYYIKDQTLMSDPDFDQLCVYLLDNWDRINHRHKHLIPYADLVAGTGYALQEEDYPGIVKGAAERLIERIT